MEYFFPVDPAATIKELKYYVTLGDDVFYLGQKDLHKATRGWVGPVTLIESFSELVAVFSLVEQSSVL